MIDPLLDVRNAHKTFGGLQAVDGVSLHVTEGEIVGIAGPNGSGKSTLFNIISGIPYGPTAGEIRFDGKRIDGWPAHRIARAGLCRTFQKDAEFADLSARETVEVGAIYGGELRSAEARLHADSALEQVGFAPERSDMPSADLSIYEKKQLMIASALVLKPRILMLDEPASGLSKPEIADLDALLLSINTRGVTIVLIEHVLGLLLSVSNRLIVLNEGTIMCEGMPDEVVKNAAVIEAYLGGPSK